jgi:hypothetical protein
LQRENKDLQQGSDKKDAHPAHFTQREIREPCTGTR